MKKDKLTADETNGPCIPFRLWPWQVAAIESLRNENFTVIEGRPIIGIWSEEIHKTWPDEFSFDEAPPKG
jgi:hypothetical protein